jgi:hypothetical protein
MSFDIVIPLGPNEIERFYQQIEYTKKNIVGFRNIYIITCNTNIKCDDCIIIDENIFPFKNFISSHFEKYNNKSNRNGWYFQQLLKLYASIYISSILDNYLVIDADVFFLKPIQFIDDENKFILSTGNEFHKPYFKHMERIHNTFQKVHKKSGICHHMIFNKQFVQEIFKIVEEKHNLPFWQVFISLVDEHKKYPVNRSESGASEYELYFNYMIKNHSDKIIIRNLNWENISISNFNKNLYNLNFDFISVCAWMN